MIRRIAWVAALLVSFWTAPAAQAYVPPSAFIVKSVAQKHAGVKGVRIKTQVKALEDGKPVEGATFKTVTSYDPQRHLLRCWAYGAQNQVLFAVERTRNEFPPVIQLLLQHDVAELTKTLIGSGIPIKQEEELLALPDEEQRRAAEVTSLKRWQGTVAWVIGNSSNAQLWVEKGSFLPLRFFSGDFEAQFANYRHFRGFPFPKTLKGGEPGAEPSIQEELLDHTVGPVTDDLKGKFPSGLSGEMGMTEAGRDAPSALRRLLENYFKHLR